MFSIAAIVLLQVIFISGGTISQTPILTFLENGFKITVSNFEGLHEVTFAGGLKNGPKFSKTLQKPNGNKWMYVNDKINVQNGDVIYFWVNYKTNDGLFDSEIIQMRRTEGIIILERYLK